MTTRIYYLKHAPTGRVLPRGEGAKLALEFVAPPCPTVRLFARPGDAQRVLTHFLAATGDERRDYQIAAFDVNL